MPKYQIIHGRTPEALRDLPDGSLAGCITDPPYCSGANVAARQKQTSAKYLNGGRKPLPSFDGDSMTEIVFYKFAVEWLELLAQKVGDGVLFCFIDWRVYPILWEAAQRAGWRLRGNIIWDKVSGRPLRNGFGCSHEFILHAEIGSPQFNRPPVMRTRSILTHSRVPPNKKLHMTEKPVALIADLLQVMPDDDRPIIDLFAGSGAVAEACLATGRGTIAVESDARFVPVIRQRLAEKSVETHICVSKASRLEK